MNIEIAVIMVLSGLNIFFMFAYAGELKRRDDFKKFLEIWFTRVQEYEAESFPNVPEWLEAEVETIKCLLKEFNK